MFSNNPLVFINACRSAGVVPEYTLASDDSMSDLPSAAKRQAACFRNYKGYVYAPSFEHPGIITLGCIGDHFTDSIDRIYDTLDIALRPPHESPGQELRDGEVEDVTSGVTYRECAPPGQIKNSDHPP